jgi:hypothetical protein
MLLMMTYVDIATAEAARNMEDLDEIDMMLLMEEVEERQRGPCECFDPFARTARAMRSLPRQVCPRLRGCYVRCNSRCPDIRQSGGLCISSAAYRI